MNQNITFLTFKKLYVKQFINILIYVKKLNSNACKFKYF